ncbi:HNH endonuclease [Enterobacter hormaechei]|uniref:HNH endonuclease n=1 Tax=Enterobacter hormaechei TaxID=158836 RepID=UPI00294A79CB|nr:HNH endonuclease [Enterobacter hormaechei]MDV5252876.1 HNH endonuclease [Enterobacter hormaechei]MDV5401762.1 HNH endonuclease [Enterobacter hormaechei]MDV5618348.1 HNH endonuclease [Enterobacter hormaechei]
MFKVTRTYPAPESLLKKVHYDSADVHDALQICFFGKCYICETKEPLDINIEHFKPKSDNNERTFDWDNLYLSCSRCNNIKLTKYDNLLDCCQETVWDRIKLLPGFSFRSKRVTVEALFDDVKTKTTAELLNKVYNSDHTISKKLTSAALRSQVTKATQKLIKNINEYYEEDTPPQHKELLIEKMKMLIRREAAFSAFCRWIIMDDNELSIILEPFMD